MTDRRDDPRAQLEALKESIKHWEEVVEAPSPEKVSIWGKDCALCVLNAIGFQNPCELCPVALDSGRKACVGTPYYNAHNEHNTLKYILRRIERSPDQEGLSQSYEDIKGRFERAAQKELDFLRGLVPEAEKRVKEFENG